MADGRGPVSACGTSLGAMLDIQFIREHADVVRESQRKRGESVELVDEVLRSDEVRRCSLKEFEAARAQQKEIGKKVAAAPADEKAALIAQTKELSQKVAEFKAAADAASEEYTTAMWKLSNIARFIKSGKVIGAGKMDRWDNATILFVVI